VPYSAREAGTAVVLETERLTDQGLLISALVINSDGTLAGWQDKEQIDRRYTPDISSKL
jgi:hypothetical protein